MSDRNDISNMVKALKKGDKKAFRGVYDRYERKLYAFIYGYTKSDAQTKDILQETFIKLWNRREELNPEHSIKSFLFKIAYNTYIDRLRRKESELKVLDNWRYKRITEALDEDMEARNLRIERVRRAIDALPKRCKEIFLLCKYEGFKYSEISEILGISTKTVQAQMVKAYKLIREEFTDNKGNLLLFVSYMHRRIRNFQFVEKESERA